MKLMTAEAAQRVERSGGDLAHVCEILSLHIKRERYATPKRESIRLAVRAMRENDAIRSINSVVMNPDDSVDLIQIGPRGGIKRITRLLNAQARPV